MDRICAQVAVYQTSSSAADSLAAAEAEADCAAAPAFGAAAVVVSEGLPEPVGVRAALPLESSLHQLLQLQHVTNFRWIRQATDVRCVWCVWCVWCGVCVLMYVREEKLELQHHLEKGPECRQVAAGMRQQTAGRRGSS